jgi:hypothetical protein
VTLKHKRVFGKAISELPKVIADLWLVSKGPWELEEQRSERPESPSGSIPSLKSLFVTGIGIALVCESFPKLRCETELWMIGDPRVPVS